MGNPVPDHEYLVRQAISLHKESLKDGYSRQEHVDCVLKDYALHQKECGGAQVFNFGNCVRGLYYLTLAKWFDRPKYELAHKALKWLK